jgi:hypothetical protein
MFVYPIYNYNWRNISAIYMYNKTSIKINILTIKKIHREVGRAKDLSATRYKSEISSVCPFKVRQVTRLSPHSFVDRSPVIQLSRVGQIALSLVFPEREPFNRWL